MKNLKDRTGESFGRLTILSRGEIASGRNYYWVCECACGNTTKVTYSNLKSGSVVSCGCFSKERLTKHGGAKHPLYQTWNGMMQRCHNPGDKNYAGYGGRGIEVCDRWKDFRNFSADMSPKPKGTSIDRIDNDKGYFLENCRWADNQTQASNKRNNNYAIVKGSKVTLSQVARENNMCFATLHDRIYKTGMTLSQAIEKPIMKAKKHDVGNGVLMTASQIAKVLGTTKDTINVRIRNGVTGSDLLKPLREYPKYEVEGEYLTVGQIAKKYNLKVVTIKQRIKYGKTGKELIAPPKIKTS